MAAKQVERFNGRISEVLATARFDAAQRLEDTLSRYVRLYNHHIPQRVRSHRAGSGPARLAGEVPRVV
jgi:hypothetical protein